MSDEVLIENLLCEIDSIDAIGLDYLATATPIVQAFIAGIRQECADRACNWIKLDVVDNRGFRSSFNDLRSAIMGTWPAREES